MTQETTVRPELYVKVCMALAVVSLVTMAVCQVILVLRPPPQPMMRRPVVPMENRVMQQGDAPASSRHDAAGGFAGPRNAGRGHAETASSAGSEFDSACQEVTLGVAPEGGGR